MSWKKFLKPDWRKIIFFIILSAAIVYVRDFGPAWVLCQATNCSVNQYFTTIVTEPLFIPFFIFAYLIACICVSSLDNMKNQVKTTGRVVLISPTEAKIVLIGGILIGLFIVAVPFIMNIPEYSVSAMGVFVIICCALIFWLYRKPRTNL